MKIPTQQKASSFKMHSLSNDDLFFFQLFYYIIGWIGTHVQNLRDFQLKIRYFKMYSFSNDDLFSLQFFYHTIGWMQIHIIKHGRFSVEEWGFLAVFDIIFKYKFIYKNPYCITMNPQKFG